MGDNEEKDSRPESGTIIRAKNGDVMRYDSTGLVMVLSDRVISDIARRLPGCDAGAAPAPRDWIDPRVVGDIDAWDLRRDGEWLLFHANLPGKQGPRLFRRLAEADSAEIEPAVIADGAGPLMGLFSIGGPRRATRYDIPLSYPWHVLAPADDLGAVGHAAAEHAIVCSALEGLRENTRDAALADVLVGRQHTDHRALSLFVTRCETDSSASIAELSSGDAYKNLLIAFQSLKAAADRMGRPAVLYAIGLDFALEDIRSDAVCYRDGVFRLLAQISADVAKIGLRRPPVLAIFDCGTHLVNDGPVLRAQWELAWQGPDHGLTYTAPGYMFRQDRFGRADKAAVVQMAEMEAQALDTLHGGNEWFCPMFLLAERDPDPTRIRVRARSLSKLVIDADDPFGAGPTCGFSLSGITNGARIESVTICEDDPQDVILTLDKPAEGTAPEVLYAFGMTPERRGTDFPLACGSLRDTWECESETGTRLHRWALPAALPLW